MVNVFFFFKGFVGIFFFIFGIGLEFLIGMIKYVLLLEIEVMWCICESF